MKIENENEDDTWTRDGVQRLYLSYCARLGQTPRDITPTYLPERTWVSSVMDKIIAGVEDGDRACALVALDFIEQDAKFPFGKTLKSNAARALRRSALEELDKERIRARVIGLLERGLVPHEFGECAKLLKRIGLAGWRARLEAVQSENPYVTRFRSGILAAELFNHNKRRDPARQE